MKMMYTDMQRKLYVHILPSVNMGPLQRITCTNPICLLQSVLHVYVTMNQRWSEYNTNVLEYDYFEHARVRVLRKQMYSVRVRLLYNILEYEYDYFIM